MDTSALIGIAAALALALVAYLIGVGRRHPATPRTLREAPVDDDAGVGIILENALMAIAHCKFDPPVSIHQPPDEIIKQGYASGYHADWNSAYAKQYGYDAGFDMSTVKLADILPLSDQRNYDFIRRFVDNDFHAIREETFESDRHGNTIEFLVSCAGGVRRDHLVEVWITMIDITALNNARSALLFSEQKFSTAFHSSPDAILITRLDDGCIVDVNAGFENISGYRAGEAVGKTTRALNLWRNLEQRDRWIESLRQHGSSRNIDVEFRHKDGATIFCLVSADTIEIEGEAHVLSTVRDVTREKEAERERLALEAELRQSQKMEAVGQLTSGIAHDFNNILASVVGFTELAAQLPSARDDETLADYLEGALGASSRARDLVAQILTFSRKNESQPLSTDVGKLVGSVVGLLRPTMPASIDLQIAADEQPILIHIDPAQLEQVLINLCINAKDAMHGEGTIRIATRAATDISTRCVSCGESVEGRFTTIEVSDTGVGIATEPINQVFKPFFTTKAAGEGTGMGLAMVDRITHGHHGHIAVDSDPARGTSFRLYFPPEDGTGVQDPGEERQLDRQLPRKISGRILVVDDAQTVGTLLAQLIESRGYGAVVCNDGEHALRYYEDNRDKVDLVVTDQSMPGMTGIQLSRKLLQLDPDLPIILLSGYSTEVEIESASKLGIRSCLSKPIELDKLFRSIAEILGNEGPDAI